MGFTRQDLLPFQETTQYLDFVLSCDYSRESRIMSLCVGPTGAGKTAAAHRYVTSRQRMTGNGRPATLYVQLAPSDKTDRALNNTLVAAIRGGDREDRSASVARAEVIRLIEKYGYDSMIVDEGGSMFESGYEELRTLHDLMDGFPIVTIVMPNSVPKIERIVPAFYSRIGDHINFDTITIEQIREIILPNLSKRSHLQLPEPQPKRDALITELERLASGNFRNLMDILLRVNYKIQESIDDRVALKEAGVAEGLPPLVKFDVATVREAARKAKQSGVDTNRIVSKRSMAGNKSVNEGQESKAEANSENTSEADTESVFKTAPVT